MHEELPVLDEYVPTPQPEQALLPAAALVPGKHAVHEVDPIVGPDTYPAGQETHSEEPSDG